MLASVSWALGALGNWEGVYLMFMVSSVLGLWVSSLLLLLLLKRRGEHFWGVSDCGDPKMVVFRAGTCTESIESWRVGQK